MKELKYHCIMLSLSIVFAGSSAFAGKVGAIKEVQARQVQWLEKWVEEDVNFNDKHFDWFTFPVDSPSVAYGDTYTITKENQEELLNDSAFLKSFEQGISLTCLSWGWDLGQHKNSSNSKAAHPIAPVRLYKMGRSAKLFHRNDIYKSLKALADARNLKGVLSLWEDLEAQGFFVQNFLKTL